MAEPGLVLILSGGISRRMGRPKALLPLYEGCSTTFIERLDHITAPVSSRRAVVSSLPATELPVSLPVVLQPRPEEGQLSSLLLGWEAFGQDASWVMMCPVDHPYVTAEVPELLAQATRRVPEALMWCPSYGRKGGHPVVFSSALRPLLKAAPLEKGARPVVRALGEKRCWVEVEDEAVLWDADTPEDYRRWSEAFKNRR